MIGLAKFKNISVDSLNKKLREMQKNYDAKIISIQVVNNADSSLDSFYVTYDCVTELTEDGTMDIVELE